MITIAFEIIAILIFWKLADFTLKKQFFPIVMTAIFLRFFEHYLLIDWFKIHEIKGGKHAQVWLPMSANLTIWPISAYLYIQFMPKKHKLLYGLAWAFMMTFYLQILVWFNVITFTKGWNIGFTYIVVSVNYFIIYRLWRWISKGIVQKEQDKGM